MKYIVKPSDIYRDKEALRIRMRDLKVIDFRPVNADDWFIDMSGFLTQARDNSIREPRFIVEGKKILSAFDTLWE